VFFYYSVCISEQLKKCVAIINEATTLQRHQQAAHQALYQEWAAQNGFTSMLPVNTKHCREEESRQQSGTSISHQPSLDGHLVPTDTIIQYSDSTFHDAAIEWLVATDQVRIVTQVQQMMFATNK
jgi:hypothetical protein